MTLAKKIPLPSILARVVMITSFTLPATLLAQQADHNEHEEHDEHAEIEEIVVSSTRNRRSFADQPTRVEVLAGEEINEKANMKPGDIRMLLNESTGIHVQQTSPTSFNSSIRIQGLDGKYTQLLRDGMPLFGGFSGSLSLLQIAPLDLQQVEVIKGANSTLYGGGAISGLVNLISKRPAGEPETSVLLNATSARGLDASAFSSGWRGDLGGTVFTSYNRSEGYDPADNGLSAIPKFERWTFAPKLFFEGERSRGNIGLSAVVEDRLGGEMAFINGDRSRPAFFEKSETSRLSSQFDYSRQLSSGRELVVRNSISHFDRELILPDWQFSGVQFSSFSEAHVLGYLGAIDWVAGVTVQTEDFDHRPLSANDFNHDFSHSTFGGFFQGTASLTDTISVESGLRIDHSSNYGNFLLPRVSLMYQLDDATTLRLGGGLGYSTPSLFSDDAEDLHYQNVRPLEASRLDAERSAGVNMDLNRSFELEQGVDLNVNLLLFYTQVDDPLRLLRQADDTYAFAQPYDRLDTRGSEINARFTWGDLKLFLGYTYTDVQEHRGNETRDYPLVPRSRLNNVLVYERHGDLRVGLEAYYYGPQTLNDGSDSKSYWIYGLMMEKYINEDSSVFLNFENFTDTRQTRFESIYGGPIQNPEFRDIYAPLDGFVINGGVKLTF
ncbi:TonB-dependent receptor [Pseudohongiella sp. SYSU M77423]|uniref:TonB-dependent receptor plug domain-containing protein n=1 Tax=Pseudohongiella sp. SYSU M77423 TaxID=3042312 RepID=UPI002480669F|nr:TonB-dependent receptor [Pseudohongiella sp. SYSU M77423]MDH7944989.1 TonB-dependent receptor [Pseudohongiella sp. SYSU M77423]